MVRLKMPDHAGSRDQATDLLSPLPSDLTGTTVALDCSAVVVTTPSFMDEIVKQVLEQRHAKTLEVSSAPQRAGELLKRAAENRGVRDRLQVSVKFC
jgi:hypothetical protein